MLQSLVRGLCAPLPASFAFTQTSMHRYPYRRSVTHTGVPPTLIISTFKNRLPSSLKTTTLPFDSLAVPAAALVTVVIPAVA
jgi:hypothetical protein